MMESKPNNLSTANNKEEMKKVFKNPKLIIVIILCVVAILIVLFATDLGVMIFDHQNYEIYQCAKDAVLSELAYPDTASFPSFSKVNIRKSENSTQIILDSYSGGQGGSFNGAWDVSGTAKSENALGMMCNVSFKATIVSKNGTYKCYNVEIN